MAAAAQQLGIFRRLAEGPSTTAELRDALSLSSRGVEALLGALTELGLVRGEEEGWSLTGQGRARFVDRDAPDYEGAATELWRAHLRRWTAELGEAVRRGSAPRGEEPEEEADEEARLRRFLAAMDNKDPELVRSAVQACLARLEPARRDRARILDLGGGPGTFVRAFAAQGARTVLFDRPEVLEVAGGDYGLAEHPQVELRPGDFLEALPEGPFDLVLLANITHIYDPATNTDLLRRVREILRPEGVVAVLDFVRGQSPFAALFAITMLLNTERGSTYERGQYETWLREAGFEATRFHRLDADRHLITARRPSEAP